LAGPSTVEIDGFPYHIADNWDCKSSSDSASKVDSTKEEDVKVKLPSAVNEWPQ
jgi:hypothetical protein